MELQGLGSLNVPIKSQGIQPGQRFFVEIIHREPNGKAQIRLGGQVIPALLEITTKPGDKFWVRVNRIDDSGIVLARDKGAYVDAQLLDAKGRGLLYIEFGQNKENSLSNLLRQILNDGKSAPLSSDGKSAPLSSDGKSAPLSSDGKSAPLSSDGKSAPLSSDGKSAPLSSDGKSALLPSDVKNAPLPSDGKSALLPSDVKNAPLSSDGKSAPLSSDVKNAPLPSDGKSAPLSSDEINISGKELIALFVNNNVPQWSSLSKDSFMQLFLLFKGLGLDYERRLMNLDVAEKEQNLNLRGELKNTLKGILLSLLAGGDANTEEKSLAANLLERLTGQQILLQGGNSEAPFYLMEIPLRLDGDLYNQTLAIKASRKGKKLDFNHCRLALRAETPRLGELGIEGWIYESQLTLKVFSDEPEYIKLLVEDSFAQTSEIFNQLGMVLSPIAVGPLKTAEEFHRFLKGDLREGVDYKV